MLLDWCWECGVGWGWGTELETMTPMGQKGRGANNRMMFMKQANLSAVKGHGLFLPGTRG